jgi:hypothetical protein
MLPMNACLGLISASFVFIVSGSKSRKYMALVKGLKPDLVGVFGDLPTGRKVSWQDIEVSVESKNSVKEIVKQAATYARCSLLNNLRRFFSLAMGFNFKTLEAFVFVFHRSGLSASFPLKFKTDEGFNGLVKHIVGILSIRGDAAYGLDVTRTQTMFCINNRYYRLLRYLYLCGSLRGRGTAVYSLEGMYLRRF